jgi:molecular chaperone IbpA
MTRLVPTNVFNDLRHDPFLVGFDQFFDRLLSTGVGTTQAASYPPYNIVKITDDEFRIEIAIAGFAEDEVEVTVQDDKLTVESIKDHSAEENVDEVMLHRGIAERNFKRVWTLSPTIAVTGAKFVNGLLTISLKNEVPEKLKPRKISFS